MRFLITVILLTSFDLPVLSQDISYALEIDSIWISSYKPRLLHRKKEIHENVRIEYSFYKRSKKMRSIVLLDKPAKKNLLFFFIDDQLVMLSPSGQPPYYISNDKLVYAMDMKHNQAQLDVMIAKAYELLERGYKKIRR